MGFEVKSVFYFVVLTSASIYCFVERIDDYPLTISCFVHYLHEKGKLDELPSTVQPPSRCALVMAYIRHSFIEDDTDLYLPTVADCVKSEMVNGDIFEYLLKRNLLEHSSLFGDPAGRALFKVTDNHLNSLFYGLIDKCDFTKPEAKKNATLEYLQQKYCMRKYALENQLFDVNDNADINLDGIDTEIVNCTNIVAAQRSKIEAQFKDKISTSDCVMNEFRSENLFDWNVIVNIVNVNNRITKKIEQFLAKPASECVV